MARPKAKAPARSYHISGQTIVRIDGKDYYLGKHDSPESIARYAVLIGIYQKHGLSLPQDFNVDCMEEMVSVLFGHLAPNAATKPEGPKTVAHVTASYREHIKTKYKHSPQDRQRHERLCEILEEHYADVPAVDFGPLRLAEVRDYLTSNGLRKGEVRKQPSRSYVNRLVYAVIAIFKYGVSKQLVTIDKVHQLQTLQTLNYGQTDAPEGQEREPVNLMHVRTTAAFSSPIVKSMLRVGDSKQTSTAKEWQHELEKKGSGRRKIGKEDYYAKDVMCLGCDRSVQTRHAKSRWQRRCKTKVRSRQALGDHPFASGSRMSLTWPIRRGISPNHRTD